MTRIRYLNTKKLRKQVGSFLAETVLRKPLIGLLALSLPFILWSEGKVSQTLLLVKLSSWKKLMLIGIIHLVFSRNFWIILIRWGRRRRFWHYYSWGWLHFNLCSCCFGLCWWEGRYMTINATNQVLCFFSSTMTMYFCKYCFYLGIATEQLWTALVVENGKEFWCAIHFVIWPCFRLLGS